MTAVEPTDLPLRRSERRAQPNGDVKSYLTTTVGLVTAVHGAATNVMAAEWTYFVSSEPLHVAVALSELTVTHRLVAREGAFGVTICSASQAAIADLVGSFSRADVDKLSSRDIPMIASRRIAPDRVAGGLLSAECLVRHIVELPGYRLVIGEAVEVDLHPEQLGDPLVKHGSMYRLGERIADGGGGMVAAATLWLDEADRSRGLLRVVGSTRFLRRPPPVVEIDLCEKDGTSRSQLGWAEPNEKGDVWFEVEAAEIDEVAGLRDFVVELRAPTGERCVADIACDVPSAGRGAWRQRRDERG
jgi:flavin reductase (DIM6/NTAB) family NADH-FMN oxidoreductase RutF